MSKQHHEPRRGAPRPMQDDLIAPPAYLTAEQAELFMQAARSRPGYWVPADLIMLEQYAVCAAYIKAAHRRDEGVEINPTQYARAGRELRTLMRELRLSPIVRDPNGQATVAVPAGVNQEAAREFVATRPAVVGLPAWSRAAEAV